MTDTKKTHCFGEIVDFEIPVIDSSSQRKLEEISILFSKEREVDNTKFEERIEKIKRLQMEGQKKVVNEFVKNLGVLPNNTSRVIDGSGGILNGVRLTNEEKIKYNVSLPDELSIYDIAELWSNDKRERNIYMDAMYIAFDKGTLKGAQCERPYDCEARFNGVFMDIKIRRNDFKAWLENNSVDLHDKCSLGGWCKDDVLSDQVDIDSNKPFFKFIPIHNKSNVLSINQITKHIRNDPDYAALSKYAKVNKVPSRRKKIMQPIRDRDGLNLLIRKICKHYKVDYLDELCGVEAWGKIISCEYSDELIINISDSKSRISLTDGSKHTKSDFIERYQKRFK